MTIDASTIANPADHITTRETLDLVARSLVFVWPFRRQVAVKIFLSLIGVSVVLVLPWPLKILIDHVVLGMPIGTSPTPFPPYILPFVDMLQGFSPTEIVVATVTVSLLGIVLIGAFGNGVAQDRAQGGLAQGLDTATQSENLANESSSSVGGLLGLFEYTYQLRTTHRINHLLRTMVFDRLVAQPMTRFSDSSIGDAVYRTMYDTPSISKVCYDILVLPLASVFSISVMIWTMTYSFAAVPSLVTVAWSVAPMVLIGSFLMTGISRQRSLKSREAGSQTTANVEEGMSSIIAVQSLGANNQQRDKFGTDSEQSFLMFRSYLLITMLFLGLQGLIFSGAILYVFFDVAEATIIGAMSPGDYAVLFTYFIGMVVSVNVLGTLWFNLQNNVVGMRRVFQVLDAKIDSDYHGTKIAEPINRVRIDNVSFHYPDGTSALSRVSLEGRVGEMIALVGATGAGKTTLAQLLPGFVRPTEGRVLLDNVNLNDLTIESVRQQVSYVFQEPIVFDDTAANNILLGKPDATREDIERAARTAGAFAFIDNLPEGFNTRLGRAGGTLSVGQKQRLSMARGLVSAAPVLILDEPTAALDPETENALVAALQVEREQRLLIVIAHRLSTIVSADRIYFMDDGKIIEQGSHAELMTITAGAYRRFVELQSGELPAANFTS